MVSEVRRLSISETAMNLLYRPEPNRALFLSFSLVVDDEQRSRCLLRVFMGVPSLGLASPHYTSNPKYGGRKKHICIAGEQK